MTYFHAPISSITSRLECDNESKLTAHSLSALSYTHQCTACNK